MNEGMCRFVFDDLCEETVQSNESCIRVVM